MPTDPTTRPPLADPEFDTRWPHALLEHVVRAPSQYDENWRAMAAEILRLRAVLLEIANA